MRRRHQSDHVQKGRKRTFRIGLGIVGALFVANLLYGIKSLAGYDIDPRGHHGNLFPLGNWIYRSFRNRDPRLSFEGPYRHVERTTAQGHAEGWIAAGWSDNSTWGPASLRYRSVPSELPDHRLVQRIEITRVDPHGACQFVQSVDLEPERTYRITATVRALHPLKVALLLRQGPAPYRSLAQAEAILGPRWQTLTAEGVAHAADLDDGSALLILRTTESGTFDVRAATLAPAPR